jgi:hypothetical protein
MKLFWCFSLLGILAFAGPSFGAKPEKSTATPEPEKVDLFAAIEAGDIDVKLICKDSTTGNVIITNKTKRPLAIKMPDAFAGVPIAGQFGGCPGGCPGGGGGFGGGGGGGGNQGVGGGGGGFGGGGGGFGGGGGGFGGGGGGGIFNVAPEKVAKVKVVTVCLEHGKEDPNPRIPYELRPINAFTENEKVIELVKMVARGEIDQHSAQAAAWHLANDMTWQELARKVGRKHLNGATEPYFTPAHLNRALVATRIAVERAEKSQTTSPGEQTAVSAAVLNQQ